MKKETFWISTTRGVYSYYAVMLSEDDTSGVVEVEETGTHYQTHAEAIEDAKHWAERECLEYKP